jgi:hypothetical protein
MKWNRTLAALSATMILPFALVACGPGDDADLDTADDLGTPAATPAPETPPAATTDMEEMTIPFAPVGASTVMGEVVVDDENDGQATEITVRLTGSTAGAVHQGHIHTGTCDAPGEVVAPLEPVTIGDDGNGEATVTASLPTMTVANGTHIVLYHEAGGTPGAPVACAAIPAHAM